MFSHRNNSNTLLKRHMSQKIQFNENEKKKEIYETNKLITQTVHVYSNKIVKFLQKYYLSGDRLGIITLNMIPLLKRYCESENKNYFCTTMVA